MTLFTHPQIMTLRRRSIRAYAALAIMVLLMAGAFFVRGSGLWYILRHGHRPFIKPIAGAPHVTGSQPSDGDDNCLPEMPIQCYLDLPNAPVDRATLNSPNVRLIKSMEGALVPVSVELTPSGHRIVIHPSQPLEPNTNYTFCITDKLKDTRGVAFKPWSVAFTMQAKAGSVDKTLRFDSKRLKNTSGNSFTCVRIGPDHKLYAGTDDGRILRYDINADGTLDHPLEITSLVTAWKGKRIIIGFCFDPHATADNLILYVTHNEWTPNVNFEQAHDFTGAVARLSGASLETVSDVIIHLPRSHRDHMTNQPMFGPDGALYISQGSNTAFGAPDVDWTTNTVYSQNPERLLNASILRVDLGKLPEKLPLDVLTPDGGGKYDPAAPGAPVTLYGTGIRNAYSLCWHSNGHLYIPTNGSSPGGNVPQGPRSPAISNLQFSEDDFLFDAKPGRYFGHPNPAQNHFVLHGGNPKSADAVQRIDKYPLGTMPEPDFTPACYNFGKHISANGVIEYLGPALNGHLDHKLMVCRYNVGSDIILLTVDAAGHITNGQGGIPGLKNLSCPLDLCEDLASGNLYIAEYGGKRLMIAKPTTAKGPETPAKEEAPATPENNVRSD